MPKSKGDKILRDEIMVLRNPNQPAPELMRRVVALVEVDGQEREMVFLTNNLEWIPRSVADLYRCRWEIEGFFKQIKQTLQLADFLGNSANAVRWQVWMALLTYLLLRYLSYLSKWSHSFTRLFTILRAVLWDKLNLGDLLDRYGTAKGHFRNLAPGTGVFPGIPLGYGTAAASTQKRCSLARVRRPPKIPNRVLGSLLIFLRHLKEILSFPQLWDGCETKTPHNPGQRHGRVLPKPQGNSYLVRVSFEMLFQRALRPFQLSQFFLDQAVGLFFCRLAQLHGKMLGTYWILSFGAVGIRSDCRTVKTES